MPSSAVPNFASGTVILLKSNPVRLIVTVPVSSGAVRLSTGWVEFGFVTVTVTTLDAATAETIEAWSSATAPLECELFGS